MSAHRRNRLVELLHAGRRRPARTATLGLLVAVLSATAGLGIALTSQSEPEPAQASTARTDERASRGKPRTVPSATPTPSVAPKPVSPSPAKAATTATRRASPTATRSTAKPAPAPAGCGSYSGNRLTACRLLSSYGFSTRQMPALDQLWTHESNWRHTASNPSSGAYGIPQALPGSKMGSVASDWRTNPTTQIRWGLGYIKQVYRTPASAWAHFQSHNWY